MKKIIYVMMLALTLLTSSCGAKKEGNPDDATASNGVEVLYFHGAQRCATCKAVGKFSQELVNELGDQNIEWKEIDLSTPEGEQIGDKYEITGSGLVITCGDRYKDVTEMAFRLVRTDTPKFKENLNKEIQNIQK